MNKIQIVSRTLHALFMIAFVVSPVILIMFWVQAPDSLQLLGSSMGARFGEIPKGVVIMQPLSVITKFLGFLVGSITTGLHMLIYFSLMQLFTLYRHNDIFSLRHIQLIKRVAYVLLISEIINPFCQAALSAIATWHNPPDHRMAVVMMSGMNFAMMITAIIILFIGWIMKEGYHLQQENSLTV